MLYLLLFFNCGEPVLCRVPDGVALVCTLLYWIWLIFDNVDGKQARRTNSSSPLGLLFDHQVDALNVTITATFIGVTGYFEDPSQLMVLWLIGAVPFFFATWEEYLTGKMDLPIINGPCDGCLILGILGFLFSTLTPEYFRSTFVLGMHLIDWFYYFFVVTALLTGAYNFLRVLKSQANAERILASTFGFLYILFTISHVYMFSPVLFAHTRMFMLCIGLVFAKEVGFVQIAHVSNSQYDPLGNANYFILSAILLNTSLSAWGFPSVEEYTMLLVLLIVSAFSYLHMVYSVVQEITGELGIYVFKVKVKDFN